jgi:endonuclease/exonuclease/phosphatase family metal-dependent hydrolase
MPELRLLTYNVRSLRDDAHAVADVIRACRPDVVAVQEAPRFLRWRSKRAALARESGLVVATADRPGGLMVMTTLAAKIVRTGFELLPKTPKLHARAVCWASMELGGAPWTVASVHLSLSAEERVRHLPALWGALESAGDMPLVVAGDVNEEPGGTVWAELAERLPDAFVVAPSGSANTYSATTPRKRIDGVFVDRRIEVVECRAVDDVPRLQVASDHLPVLAVLRQ